MRYSSANMGVLLAIIAGVILIALAVWPVVAPQADVGSDSWVFGAFAIGIAFLASAYIADRNSTLSRIILAVGAIALIGSGLFFGSILGGNLLAAALDIVPAIIALVAATMIGPIRRGVFP